MTELQTHLAFSAYLNKQGILAIHCRTDQKSTIAVGWPDYSLFLPNQKVLLIEFKQIKKKPRPEQQAMIDRLRGLGFDVHVMYDCETAIRCVEQELAVAGKEVTSLPEPRLNSVSSFNDPRNPVLGASLKGSIEPGADTVTAKSSPKIWLASSSSLGCDVVVARNQEGHLGAIRIATQADGANLPRLPQGIA